MTTVARRVRSVPVRTATDTWRFIVELIARSDDAMRSRLDEAGNAAAMLIGEEYTKNAPIILSGCGPQVRIYTVHGAAAVDGDHANEQGLVLTPTNSWELALPASGVDLELAASVVDGIDHVTVYDLNEARASTASGLSQRASAPITVDVAVLEELRWPPRFM